MLKHTKHPIVTMLFTGALALGLQACGSSSSDSGPDVNGSSESGINTEDSVTEDLIFANPVDSATLRTALITGAGSGDDVEFWQCALSGTNISLAYRLFADGSGFETDIANPGARSEFTWQATSASGMTTTVASSGIQNNLTSIEFNDRNTMSMVLAESNSVLMCNRQANVTEAPAETTSPIASNTLYYGGIIYPLTHGFEEVFSFRPETRGDTHMAAQFQVADSMFEPLFITTGLTDLTIWRPRFASVWLRADLYSPGGDGFESATFTYEPNSTDVRGPLVANKFFFNDGRLGIDTNEDGSIDSEFNEFFDIVDGTISIERMGEPTRMTFDVTLEDGVNVRGSFTGNFPVF